jgi:glycogen debranching enzyme
VLLRASLDFDAVELSVDATCRAHGALHAGDLHLAREVLLDPGFLYERIRLTNLSPRRVEVRLQLKFDGDFADLFEVRGNRRPHRGKYSSELQGDAAIVLTYEGLDGVCRTLRIGLDRVPDELTRSTATFDLTLKPRETYQLRAAVRCSSSGPIRELLWPDFEQVREQAVRRQRSRTPELDVRTSNPGLDSALHSARTDLALLISERSTGPYPMAGIPWFATPFGRDGVITALQNLWWHPALAAGVLRFLASRQATEDNPDRDAEPGKIVHEERLGEMAALGEVPYGRYYGSVDATPLFVLLAGRYLSVTSDTALIGKILPNLRAAMAWIENYGDADGDGFVEYGRRSSDGLVQQGWKDSHDSVFHESGEMVQGPVALCEVQAYVFEAYQAMAGIEARLEGPTAAEQQSRARAWNEKAERLRTRFDAAFWDDELGMYALALDGEKRPCRVRSSNAAHCLYTGLARADRAERVKDQLLDSEMFCGWGVRTLSSRERRYNPISYHNGSVWPHDNSLIAAGLSRYGYFDAADTILEATLDLCLQRPGLRLPELVCGFSARRRGGPVPYPSACAPQAWAAGSLWLMLQASLGIEVRSGQIDTTKMRLPMKLGRMELCGVTTSLGVHDVVIEQGGKGALVNVTRRDEHQA